MSGLFVSHAEPRRGVSEANRRITAALRPEMSAPYRVYPVWCAILLEWVFVPVSYFMLRYRKATIWARVQFALGLKVVSLVPLVTPLATAHMTASP